MLLRALIKRQEDETYQAHCLEFDVTAEGSDPGKAEDHLRRAVELYLQECGYTIGAVPTPFPGAPLKLWQEFFKREDENRPDSNISFHSIFITKGGGRIIKPLGGVI